MEGAPSWNDFLVAAAGATAALAGLVFVALSINLTRIIELKSSVSGRAGETIVILAGALIGTLLALIPAQPPARLGLLLFVLWLPTWGVPSALQLKSLRRREYYELHHEVIRVLLYQTATLPLLFAALSLNGYLPGGLNWLAAMVLLSLTVALVNAWILLVEIVR